MAEKITSFDELKAQVQTYAEENVRTTEGTESPITAAEIAESHADFLDIFARGYREMVEAGVPATELAKAMLVEGQLWDYDRQSLGAVGLMEAMGVEPKLGGTKKKG